MADETPAIQNKGLLITALILAVIVVLLYNFQIERAVRQARGETISLLVFTRNLKPGDKVSAADMEARDVNVETGKGLGLAVPAREKDSIIGMSLVRSVSKDNFVMWDHFDSYSEAGSIEPSEGMVIYTLPVDRDKTPGAMLRRGNRISVWGMLPGPDGKYSSTCIIKGLKVCDIGSGESSYASGTRNTTKMLRSYDSVKVEVSEEVRRQLDNIISHVSGGLGIDKLRSDDYTGDNPQITREAAPFAQNAAGVARR